jgi:hypothetical protein
VESKQKRKVQSKENTQRKTKYRCIANSSKSFIIYHCSQRASVYRLPRLFHLIVTFFVPLLALAAKCARLLHLGSNEWYLDEIKKEYNDPKEKGYEREDVGDHIHKVLRGYAEADFEFLLLHLSGAPDEVQPGTEVEQEYIPTRLLYKPNWLDLNQSSKIQHVQAVPLAQELPALGYKGPY